MRDNQENAGMVSKEERTEVQRLWNDLPAAALPLTRNPFAALVSGLSLCAPHACCLSCLLLVAW